uniref:R-spondin 1 n=1 Tax=Felis catus TaxID=9685 RepID=A0ABI8AKB0_FELCA
FKYPAASQTSQRVQSPLWLRGSTSEPHLLPPDVHPPALPQGPEPLTPPTGEPASRPLAVTPPVHPITTRCPPPPLSLHPHCHGLAQAPGTSPLEYCRSLFICPPPPPSLHTTARKPECKIEHCEACFSHNFCTKCKESLYLHKGRCYPACPEGSAAANSTMECSSPAQCEMSEWSLWGPCSKKKRLCGFRRGSEERTRRVLHAPGGDHAACSDTKETRRCTVRRTPCPEGQKRRKGGQGRRENANRNLSRKESKEAGAGSRRRKGQQQPQHQGTAGPVTPAGLT